MCDFRVKSTLSIQPIGQSILAYYNGKIILGSMSAQLHSALHCHRSSLLRPAQAGLKFLLSLAHGPDFRTFLLLGQPCFTGWHLEIARIAGYARTHPGDLFSQKTALQSSCLLGSSLHRALLSSKILSTELFSPRRAFSTEPFSPWRSSLRRGLFSGAAEGSRKSIKKELSAGYTKDVFFTLLAFPDRAMLSYFHPCLTVCPHSFPLVGPSPICTISNVTEVSLNHRLDVNKSTTSICESSSA